MAAYHRNNRLIAKKRKGKGKGKKKKNNGIHKHSLYGINKVMIMNKNNRTKIQVQLKDMQAAASLPNGM